MLNPCDRATVQAVRWLVGGKSCATYRLGGGGRGAAGVRTLRYDCVELSPTEPHHMWVIDESARGILAQGRQILLTTRFQVARQRQGEGGGGGVAVQQCGASPALTALDPGGPLSQTATGDSRILPSITRWRGICSPPPHPPDRDCVDRRPQEGDAEIAVWHSTGTGLQPQALHFRIIMTIHSPPSPPPAPPAIRDH